MKKLLSIAVVAVLLVAMTLTASAAIESNHLFDKNFSYSNDIADVIGWIVTDDDVASIGYKVDGGDTIWVANAVVKTGELKDKACALNRDAELEDAVKNMGMANGLEWDVIHGYRVRYYLDLSYLAKGEHKITFVMKFANGTEANTFANDSNGNQSSYTINKTTDASGTAPGGVTPPSGSGDSGSGSGSGSSSGSSNPKTADASVIAIAAVACLALAGVVVAKKVR